MQKAVLKLSDKVVNKKKVTFGEVFSFILVFIFITVGLGFSFHTLMLKNQNFRIESNALEVYPILENINVKSDSLEISENLFDELKSVFPNILGIDASHVKNGNEFSFDLFDGSEYKNITSNDFEENSFAISDIKQNNAEFSFIYYGCLNGKIYAITVNNGSVGEFELLHNKTK